MQAYVIYDRQDPQVLEGHVCNIFLLFIIQTSTNTLRSFIRPIFQREIFIISRSKNRHSAQVVFVPLSLNQSPFVNSQLTTQLTRN